MEDKGNNIQSDTPTVEYEDKNVLFKKRKKRLQVSPKSSAYSKNSPQYYNIGSNLIQAGVRKTF